MAKTPKNVSPFVRHIEELYRMEIEDEYRTEAQRTVTFNFPAEDACMLAAIAKRFGRSTAAFGGELFAEHVRELFIAHPYCESQHITGHSWWQSSFDAALQPSAPFCQTSGRTSFFYIKDDQFFKRSPGVPVKKFIETTHGL